MEILTLASGHRLFVEIDCNHGTARARHFLQGLLSHVHGKVSHVCRASVPIILTEKVILVRNRSRQGLCIGGCLWIVRDDGESAIAFERLWRGQCKCKRQIEDGTYVNNIPLWVVHFVRSNDCRRNLKRGLNLFQERLGFGHLA